MIEPQIRVTKFLPVVKVKTTSAELLKLAELARKQPLNRAEMPFWKTWALDEAVVEFRLDHDGEVSARADQKREARSEKRENGNGVSRGDTEAAENGEDRTEAEMAARWRREEP